MSCLFLSVLGKLISEKMFETIVEQYMMYIYWVSRLEWSEKYSKTCLKRPLKNRQNKGLLNQW